MGRSPCCDKVGLKKGPWTPEEDQKLLAYIEEHGHGNWRALPSKAGLQRCGKSCRLRWTNYLRPDIKRGKFSLQEEQTIIQLHALLGNRWSAIATHLPKRTDNEIKNYWNTHLKKRLTKMGIDPITHKPKNDALLSGGNGGSSSGTGDINGTQSKTAANLSHMAQWESARLEAEARLARQSKLQLRHSNSSSSNNNNSVFQSQFQHHFNGLPPVCTGMVMDFPHYPTSTTTNSSSSSLNHNVITGHSTPPSSVSPPPAPQTIVRGSSSCVEVVRGSSGSNWVKSSSTGNGRSNNAEVGSSSGAVGVSTVHHHSPTSTLSFSENGTVIGVQGGESSTAAVIEFMGNGKSNEEGSTEEEEEEWKLTGKNNSNDEDDHNEYNNDGMENSMSFTSGLHYHHHDMGLSIDKNHRDETEDENHNITTVGNFMDGFTELLLSNFPERNINPLVDGSGNRDEMDNASGGGGEGVRNGEVDQLYEDNKSYWNSILNLVNSSPSSSSPLF